MIDTSNGHDTDAFNFGFAQGLGTIDTLSPDVYKSGSQNVGLIYFSDAPNLVTVGGTYIKTGSIGYILPDGRAPLRHHDPGR